MNNTINTQIANYAGAYQSMTPPAVESPKQLPTLTDTEKQVFTEAQSAWELIVTLPLEKHSYRL